MNNKNRIIRMMMDSDVVYVDGKTIKDLHNPVEITKTEDILKNINNYHITYFNRDINKGDRVLYLDTEYTL